jgi:hypothetical protein
MNYKKITQCRAGGLDDLIPVLSLGDQALTGVFPATTDEPVTTGPLELTLSPSSGLLQLSHTYDSEEMYGDNYGYRSGLNNSMLQHLSDKIKKIEKICNLKKNDVVVDIGSNDCSTLKFYSSEGIQRVGIDPTGKKFKKYYPKEIKLIADFFSAKLYWDEYKTPAKVVTSISMFYDLDDPVFFAKEVESILSEDGVWHLEQSYMPSMLRMNSYDTICHEHLEYYSLQALQNILSKANLKIIDVNMNSINGGSFAVTAVKENNNNYGVNSGLIGWLLRQEDNMQLTSPEPYKRFRRRVFKHREELRNLIEILNNDGKKVLGYGASTKGNVMLQFCDLNKEMIPAIAEVNEEKFGKITPGSHIPIISEMEAKSMNPDYFLVMPWHFKESILRRERRFIESGGKFIFPFPEIEII